MGEKVKQEPNKKEHNFGRPTTEICQNVSAPCLSCPGLRTTPKELDFTLKEGSLLVTAVPHP